MALLSIVEKKRKEEERRELNNLFLEKECRSP